MVEKADMCWRRLEKSPEQSSAGQRTCGELPRRLQRVLALHKSKEQSPSALHFFRGGRKNSRKPPRAGCTFLCLLSEHIRETFIKRVQCRRFVSDCANIQIRPVMNIVGGGNVFCSRQANSKKTVVCFSLGDYKHTHNVERFKI
jgi:hypothetical protein